MLPVLHPYYHGNTSPCYSAVTRHIFRHWLQQWSQLFRSSVWFVALHWAEIRDTGPANCVTRLVLSSVYLSSLSVNTQRKVFKFIRFPSRIVDNLSRVCRTKYWLHLNTRTHSECLNAFEYEGWVFTRYKWSRDYDNNKWICKAIRVFEYQWSVHGRVKEVEHHRIA